MAPPMPTLQHSSQWHSTRVPSVTQGSILPSNASSQHSQSTTPRTPAQPSYVNQTQQNGALQYPRPYQDLPNQPQYAPLPASRRSSSITPSQHGSVGLGISSQRHSVDPERIQQPNPLASQQYVAQYPPPYELTAASCLGRLSAYKKAHPNMLYKHQLAMMTSASRSSSGQDPMPCDPAFLLVHQILCLAASDPKSLPEEVWRIPRFAAARDALSRILLPPENMQAAHTSQWCTFPAPIQASLVWLPYRDILAHALNFIYFFSHSFDKYMHDCISRNQVPTPPEMFSVFGTLSRNLQKAIFAHVLVRGLGVDARTDFFRQQADAFKASHELYQMQVQQGQNSQPIVAQVGQMRRPHAQPQSPTNQPPHPQRQRLVSSSSMSSNGMPSRNASYSQPSLSKPPTKTTPLYPPEGKKGPQVTPPEPHRFGLHQAHLQSPQLIVQSPDPLYRYFDDFALPPQAFTNTTTSLSWKFNVTKAEFSQKASPVVPSTFGKERRRMVGYEDIMFRLRAVHGTLPTLSHECDWAISPTLWPQHTYFEVNGSRLELRMKLAHGKYLPFDLTDHIIMGENTLRLFCNMPRMPPIRHFAVAVEKVRVLSHSAVREILPVFPKDRTLSLLKSAFAANDDEVSLLQIPIRLKDPISSSSIDTPVRGARCTHRECFDLENFLSTRLRRKPEEPSVIDTWRCPICGLDARPISLAIDEWILDVKLALEERGQLGIADRILVEENGSWTVEGSGNKPSKLEQHIAVEQDPREPNREMSLNAGSTSRSSPATNPETHMTPATSVEMSPRRTKREVEVIDIDLD